jgi:hypothetical protein
MITLSLNQEQVEFMLNILGQQPFNKVANLIVDLRNQAVRQVQQQQQEAHPPMMPRANGEDRSPALEA